MSKSKVSIKFISKHKLLSASLACVACIVLFIYSSIQEINLNLLESRSQVLYDAKSNVLGYRLSKDTDSIRFLTTEKDVSPIYIKMLIANEDKNFYSHYGVDYLALLRACSGNLKSGAITSGGSTLAMQVVKRLTNHSRTYFNKFKELIQAHYITLRYGKDTVLSMYLSIAPFGSNIEGVNAASLHWFNHKASRLTPSEAALLTALPRAPEVIRPDLHPKEAFIYKNKVLKLAHANGVIDSDVYTLALHDPIDSTTYAIKTSGNTLTNVLFPSSQKHEIYTYIDPYIQSIIDNEAIDFERKKTDSAILSIVVLDDFSKTVVGILGSSNFKSSQICLPFSLRSPGSTLKPFAYAMSFDEGKLHPYTVIHDDSNLYGTWKPSNFDKTFKGEILAKDALKYSLNIPAIEVLKTIGADHFVRTINSHSMKLFTRNNTTDLSVILGSGDINLVDLTELYAMLNTDGMFYTYKLTTEDELKEPYSMIAAPAARAVYNVLLETPRPLSHPQAQGLSYKTGTSYKFKDALAVGSYHQYTVGVAIRYPTNKVGTYHYTGYKDAAPILFNVLTNLNVQKFPKQNIKDILLESNAPKALKKFQKNSTESSVISNKLKINFPAPDSTITPDYQGNVFVKYSGGTGNVFLNVGDIQTNENYFKVESSGFYRVTIFDEEGHSDSVKFKVIVAD